jgi:Tol biopolymer transport system component
VTLTNGSSFGAYEVIGRLGAGGMGEVYRARDTRLPREVAIKVSNERFSDRFAREVQIVAALNHPNISTLFDVGPDYLVMELVEGPTLAERIAEAPLTLDQAAAVARQIADALDYAHDRGVIHRDLKPSNIKIRPDGVVKVLDFGLAKSRVTNASSSDQTPTVSARDTEVGAILGTAAYMAPEQARGKEVDKRADIWAFGCVFYEMLTGGPPHQGDTSQETMASILRDEPDLSRVPAQARRLLRRCLEKDPQKRLRHIGDVMALLDETPSSEFVPQTGVIRDRPAPSRRWILAASAIVLLLAAASALVWWAPWSPEELPEAVQFEVGPAARMSFINGGAMAVSPDGRWLVFPATSDDGVTRFWIRSLSSVDVRPLQGAEVGPVTPPAGWSHDSRHVLFSQGGVLKRIDIQGGPPQPIANLQTGHNGVTSNGEVILMGLTPAARSPVLRVSVAGGATSPATALEDDDTRHAFPQFLPDGRHFLYLRVSSDVNRTGVYAGSIDEPPEKQDRQRLLATNRQAYYARSPRGGGYLVFLRERTLVAQPFDAAAMKLSGEPFPIADGVDSFANANYGLFTVSDTGTLVYRTGSASQMSLTWVDSQGQLSSSIGEPGEYAAVSLSPDGKRVAVAAGQVGSRDIHIFDVATGNSTKFTYAAGDDENPVWSPDSKDLVFSSNRTSQSKMYIRPVDGSQEERLLTDQPGVPTNWSSDGRFLLFNAAGRETAADVWVLPEPGSAGGPGKPAPVVAESGIQGQAQFSPDTRWVAYTSLESGAPHIYVRSYSYSNGTVRTGPKRLVSRVPGTSARWDKRGARLSYLSASLQVMSIAVDTHSGFEAGAPTQLFSFTSSGAALTNPMWAVDDERNRYLFVAAPPTARTEPFTVVVNWESRIGK